MGVGLAVRCKRVTARVVSLGCTTAASRRVSEINRGGVKCYIPENVRQPGHLAISKTRTLTLGAAADASAAVEHRPAASSSNNVEGIESPLRHFGLESFLLILELAYNYILFWEAWTSVRTIK